MAGRCATSEEALWAVEALSDQVGKLRHALEQRSIFSMGYNRKLARKIEFLDGLKDEYIILARDLQQASKEAK